jgi:hypothetical protein
MAACSSSDNGDGREGADAADDGDGSAGLDSSVMPPVDGNHDSGRSPETGLSDAADDGTSLVDAGSDAVSPLDGAEDSHEAEDAALDVATTPDGAADAPSDAHASWDAREDATESDGANDANDANDASPDVACHGAVACYELPDGTPIDPATLGEGVCKQGTRACDAGVLGPCLGAVGPQPEVCNGLDDNCNGQVDEGDPGGGFNCRTGLLGVCAVGTTACTGGALACPENVQPSAEVCDGLDNNCNGQVDEGNPGGGIACSTGLLGVCAAGTTACTAGAVACEENTPSSPEVCNGLDDNCDGTVDNIASAGSNYCAQGTPLRACSDAACGGAAGTQTCNACAWSACIANVDQCTAGSVSSCAAVGHTCNGTSTCTATCTTGACTYPAEVCNYVDDNCNGQIDEGVTTYCAPHYQSNGSLGFSSSWENIYDASYNHPPFDSISLITDIGNAPQNLSGSTWLATANNLSGIRSVNWFHGPNATSLFWQATLNVASTSDANGNALACGDGFALVATDNPQSGNTGDALGVADGNGFAFEVDLFHQQLRVVEMSGMVRTTLYSSSLDPSCGCDNTYVLAVDLAVSGNLFVDLTNQTATGGPASCATISQQGTAIAAGLQNVNRAVGLTAGTGNAALTADLVDFQSHRGPSCDSCLPF